MHTAVGDDRIINVNAKLCDMTGYGREELLRMTTDDLIPPDFAGMDRPRYRARMLAGEVATYSSERKFRRKNGSTFWINRTVSLARGGSSASSAPPSTRPPSASCTRPWTVAT
jgi:PAS domain S-box-containing protein